MSDADDAAAPSAGRRPSLKQRLTTLFEDYGRIAIITYFTLSGLAIIGFSVAGWLTADPSSATGVIGVIIAGWVAAKVTLPIRIVITLVLTPLVAWVLGRRRRSRGEDDDLAPGDEPLDDPPSPPAPPAPPGVTPAS
jgi:hypothetical protein